MISSSCFGPLMEENLRRAMRISSGDPMIFLTADQPRPADRRRVALACWSRCRPSAASARRAFQE